MQGKKRDLFGIEKMQNTGAWLNLNRANKNRLRSNG
jgi:hypothetical protein